jgi:hypothetical protein
VDESGKESDKQTAPNVNSSNAGSNLMESIIELSRARDAERADLPYRFAGDPVAARRWADSVERLAKIAKSGQRKPDREK